MGLPDWVTKFDPVDELVYIILSRKTREEAYQASFQALKKRFQSWDEVLLAEQSAVFELVDSGGLGEKKTRSIVGALAELDSRFGACTLEPTRSWTDEKLFRFLCGLPEVGPKSARCIMMYSLDRKVFPVDTHVGRVLSRIRPFNALGADLSGKNHKKLQRVLPPLIPPDLRYSLHVNLIAHGRAICKFQRPRCDDCCIWKDCIHGLRKSPA